MKRPTMLATILFVSAITANATLADTRVAANAPQKHMFCVKNAESGACEDCWSDGAVSSARGTCRLLKSSSGAPNVRTGRCNSPSNLDFCKPH